MRAFLIVAIAISGISISNIDHSFAQVNVRPAIEQRTQARIPARIRTRDRAVTVIKPADIHPTATFVVDAPSPPRPGAADTIKALPSLPDPTPTPGTMGNIQVAPKGKLKVTLTAKNPARQGRAYINLNYPQSVFLSDDDNHIVFSKGNIPGSLTYKIKLDKDKKYLIEILADPWGTSGGNVEHKIGDETSIHQFGQFNKKINISRVIMASESGWTYGTLRQGDNPTNQWRVYSVSINEMD